MDDIVMPGSETRYHERGRIQASDNRQMHFEKVL
jgi:hypothetical protein